MFSAVPFLPLDETLDRVKAGKGMDGCVIRASELFSALATLPHVPQSWTITDAVLPPFRCYGLTFSSRINFVRCRFVEPSFDNCTFNAPFRIEESSCDGDLVIDHCIFEKDLYFRRLETHGDVKILHTDLAIPPSWERVKFHGMVEVAAVRARWQGRRRLVIERCHFTEGIILEIPNLAEFASHRLNLALNYCTFDRNSFSKIIWGKTSLGTSGATCRFVECAIAGRLALHDDSSDSASRSQKKRAEGAQVDLSGSLISGELDIRGIKVRWLELDRVLMSGGQILLSKEDLWDRWTWRHMLRFAAGDRCGILLGEQFSYGVKNLRLPQISQQLGTPAAIAEQYETLRDSYARITNSDSEEDYCHYKCRDYRRLTRWRNLELRIDGGRVVAGAALLTSAVILSIMPVAFQLAPWYLPALIFLAGMLAPSIAFYKEAATLVDIGWDWLILKWLIGNGIYARRAVQNGLGIILIFAGVYFVTTAYWPEWGKVADGNSHTILQEITAAEKELAHACARPPTPQQVSCLVGLRRCFYFSVVTFTTLGYGDYHPEGYLELVCCAEVIIGAIMIAMITVVFARKFLR